MKAFAVKLSLLAAVFGISACQAERPPAPPFYPSPTTEPVVEQAPQRAPQRRSITDLEAFNAFIATRPTPEALRAKYPGLAVITPGMMTTRELRGDNSRYFVELDDQGRITGGKFQ